MDKMKSKYKAAYLIYGVNVFDEAISDLKYLKFKKHGL